MIRLPLRIATGAIVFGCCLFAAHADESRRLFDFTPVSAANPVVATIRGTIEIPLSELRGYREAERPQAVIDPSSLAQRRAILDELINEYLHVDAAYRAGVPASPGFIRQMEATRTMILTDFMAARAAEKAPALAEEGAAAMALAEKLFEAASIEVSNEACATLRRAAQAVDTVPSGAGSEPQLRAIVDTAPEAVLVRYGEKSISVHQVLIIYAGLPAEKRPPVATQDGIIALIKPLILPELMALEAGRRGIETEPAFQQKLAQNRNALLRFHAHGQVERQAVALLAAPDAEAQLRAWYDAHRGDYALVDATGQKRLASFAEAQPRVEGDYSVAVRDRLLAEQAQTLRREHAVWIDEKVLLAL
jgi:hypothetical protein